jgi:hypothetical protein
MRASTRSQMPLGHHLMVSALSRLLVVLDLLIAKKG